MIILMGATKGGPGKTTIAVHLADWLSRQGVRTALIDTDPQASATVWFEAGEFSFSIAAASADNLEETVERLLKTHQVIVIDIPGEARSMVIKVATLLAEIAILPMGPSMLDFWTINDARYWIKYSQGIRDGKPDEVVVLNKTRKRSKSGEQIRTTLGSKIRIAEHKIRPLDVFAEAPGDGKVIFDLKTKIARDASAELAELFYEILADKIPGLLDIKEASNA